MVDVPNADENARAVILTEDLAHLTYAHTPNRFAEIADSLERQGRRVTVLTAVGWSREHEPQAPQLQIRRYRGAALALHHVTRLLRPSERARQHRVGAHESPLLTAVRAVRSIAATTATVLAVNSVRRESAWASADVVTLSVDVDARVLASLAPRGRWLVTCFRNPAFRWPSGVSRRGSTVTLSTPSADLAHTWTQALPSATVRVLPLAGVRTEVQAPNARQSLGLDPQWNIALLFGTEHPERRSQLVIDAVRLNPQWHLLVAGQLATTITVPDEPWARERIHVLPGSVSSAQRHMCYSAADVVVLSFMANYQRNSGTLMDAVSHGIPVACSDSSFAATLVRNYQLGSLFAPGDGHDLARALDDARPLADPAGLERIRADYSNNAVAARMMAAFD